MPSFDTEAFMRRLMSAAQRRGKTMKDVAAETGVSETTLSRMTDIPLPEPAMWYARGTVFSLKAIMQQGWHLEATGLFDANKMRAYAAAAVAAERERCARIVEEFDYLRGSYSGRAIARAIRDGDPATDPEPPA